jgi:hypothetical protein
MATERVARTVFIVDVVWELRVAGQGARATTKVMLEMVIVGGTGVDFPCLFLTPKLSIVER